MALHMDLVPPWSFPIFVQQLLSPHKFFGVAKSSFWNFILYAAILLDSVWHLRNDVVHNGV